MLCVLVFLTIYLKSHSLKEGLTCKLMFAVGICDVYLLHFKVVAHRKHPNTDRSVHFTSFKSFFGLLFCRQYEECNVCRFLRHEVLDDVDVAWQSF